MTVDDSFTMIFNVLGLYLWPLAILGFNMLHVHKVKKGSGYGKAFKSYGIHGFLWPLYVYFTMGVIPIVIVAAMVFGIYYFIIKFCSGIYDLLFLDLSKT